MPLSDTQSLAQPPSTSSITPQSSASRLIPSDQRQPAADDGPDAASLNNTPDSKGIKKNMLGLSSHAAEKRKDDEDASSGAAANMGVPMPPQDAAAAAAQPFSSEPSSQPLQSKSLPQPIAVSPSRLPYASAMAASPSHLATSSARLHSPASSEIFERNVQEPVPIATLSGERTPAHIPNHVITEDHIPAALEASAQAITSEDLNPDEVEIVTSASHQPAAASVLDGSASQADVSSLSASGHLGAARSDETESVAAQSGFLPPADEEGASNYGSLDPHDVRRLSFISFADVVQSEHQHHPASSVLGEAGSRDSLHIASPPGSFPSPGGPTHERAASPLRSPRSPRSTTNTTPQPNGAGVTTPPTGLDARTLSTERSPVRSAAIGSTSGNHGELTIETMRQAVRKTASGDLGQGQGQGLGPGVRSPGITPISSHDEALGRSRTNT